MRILLVEDDGALGEGIRVALKPEAYTVDWVRDGASALHALTHEDFALAVLDLGLPRMDGLQVLQRLRAAANPVPVLVLTARDATGDRIAGLDAGADDYLVKPFATDELLARLRALGRRTGDPAAPEFRIGNLTYTPRTMTLVVADQPVRLTVQEHAALDRLLRAGDRITPKRRMGEHVYAFHHDWSDNAVETLIHRLRKKLSGAGATVELRALRGLGYLLVEVPE